MELKMKFIKTKFKNFFFTILIVGWGEMNMINAKMLCRNDENISLPLLTNFIELKKCNEIEYPKEAISKKLEDEVVLQIKVDKKGDIVKMHIKKGRYCIFKNEVLENVKKWKFNPVIINSLPVQLIAFLNFKFKNEDNIYKVFWEFLDDIECMDCFPDSKSTHFRLTKMTFPKLKIEKEKKEFEFIIRSETDVFGKFKKIEFIKGNNEEYKNEIVKALNRWVIEPMIIGSPPIVLIVNLKFYFQDNRIFIELPESLY